ncbi:hypothetical protein HYFRA_00003922 [Hymenoscyphus fraxineus]|uniref:Uncharacterized protein n=1 Tax=Hymenoscyphus fraxineus TaxID=746836 RepID=A0A9N9KZ54_9HELO|nr:hypothetical protein HYFRA_00003922 [Hymenoscyphus fraxineus]
MSLSGRQNKELERLPRMRVAADQITSDVGTNEWSPSPGGLGGRKLPYPADLPTNMNNIASDLL